MPPVCWLPLGSSWCYDLRRCFAAAGKTSPRIIFDVGANIGETALHMRLHFPRAKIHAFEPVEAVFEVLKKRTQEDALTVAHNFALGAVTREQTITLYKNSEFNTLKPDPGNCSQQKIGEAVVQVKSLDDFLAEWKIAGIDFLKMDVQGYEIEVLRGAKVALSNGMLKAVLAEVDFSGKSSEFTHFKDIHEVLRCNGFHFLNLYECYRYGCYREFLLFCNALWVNWDALYSRAKDAESSC